MRRSIVDSIALLERARIVAWLRSTGEEGEAASALLAAADKIEDGVHADTPTHG